MQSIFDELYRKAKKGIKFNNLIRYIEDERNILLAYRNLKGNKGSETCGVDKITLKYYDNFTTERFVKFIRKLIRNYKPKKVRRVEIPKSNGKTRPLGIPCVQDRIVQQCIKQVIEPILEAQFHPHSYGFRPNRGTSHALARCQSLVNLSNLHHVVDIDIKGFFDNINHGKLLKQLWALGIQDKNLITVISKILKSEVVGFGIQTKGTPQGGIISPLLSNVVLNELDWWISNQWETFQTNHDYTQIRKDGRVDQSNKYASLRNYSEVKEMWIVRYADDFKIFCKNAKTASIVYKRTTNWLNKRLNLEISTDKSQITNLRKRHSEFLGFKLKAHCDNPKASKRKYTCRTQMTDKAKENVINDLKEQIKEVQTDVCTEKMQRLNSIILGVHQYYKSATLVSRDMAEISYVVMKTFDIRLRNHISRTPNKSKAYLSIYGKYQSKVRTVASVTLFPVHGIKYRRVKVFNQQTCNYTVIGRRHIHDSITGYDHLINNIMKNKWNDDVELLNNKLALIYGQHGKCAITHEPLVVGNMECHHIRPRHVGGGNEYKNLMWLSTIIHKLIHATQSETILQYLDILKLDDKQMHKINSLRKSLENNTINISQNYC